MYSDGVFSCCKLVVVRCDLGVNGVAGGGHRVGLGTCAVSNEHGLGLSLERTEVAELCRSLRF